MTYWGFIARNLRRDGLRTWLTGASIGLSIFLVCAVLTLPQGFRAMLDRLASATRISVHSKAGLGYLMPFGALAKVRAIPGVVAATSFTWFGGIYDAPQDLFPNFATDPDSTGEVWPDYRIAPAALAEFRRHRDGALVGYQTMRTFGWKVGDRVNLRGTFWPVDLSLRIDGVIPEGGNPVWMLFSRVYLEETLRARGFGGDSIGMIWVRVADAADVQRVMGQIDDVFRGGGNDIVVETEKSFLTGFLGSLSGIMWIVAAVGFLVVGAVVFIAANACAMSIHERAREIAVLKALGFRPRIVLALLLGETSVVSLCGGVAGALTSYGLFDLMARFGESSINPVVNPLSMFVMDARIAGEGVSLSIVLGALAGILPAWRAARCSVAVVLREPV